LVWLVLDQVYLTSSINFIYILLRNILMRSEHRNHKNLVCLEYLNNTEENITGMIHHLVTTSEAWLLLVTRAFYIWNEDSRHHLLHIFSGLDWRSALQGKDRVWVQVPRFKILLNISRPCTSNLESRNQII